MNNSPFTPRTSTRRNSTPHRGRRNFLKQHLALAAWLGCGVDVLNIGPVASAANTAGYKALVCVYLAGGNDSFNMFVPQSQSEHALYAQARQFLAVPSAQLLPVAPSSYNDGASYGFHPNMPEVHTLFEQGALSVIANVGPLVNPVSKSGYEARSDAIPEQLFSHNDQTDLWMAGDASHRTGLGWAGRMMDIIYANGNTPRPSPSISVGGNNLWQSGTNIRSFEISAGGIESAYLPYHEGPLKLGDAYATAYQAAQSKTHKLLSEHALVQDRAIEYSQLVNQALGFAPDLSSTFGSGPLQQQLQMVARLLAVRDRLDTGFNRQVFFVRLGGWDTHAAQLEDTSTSHPNLLRQLSQSLGEFNSALSQLSLQNEVTTFTATEFGRSLTPNGSGTDHGWGGHNLVMGGSVRGGDIIGTMPELKLDSPDAVEDGRIIPSTSVDQYSATLAHWFGLSRAESAALFPNLSLFPSDDLGFMQQS